MSAAEFLTCNLVMLAAATLHGSVGVGMALVSAPVLMLIDPDLVPAPLIVTGLILVAGMAIRERHEVAIGEVSWTAFGCIFGTSTAAALLSVISRDAFELVFATMLVLAVTVSLVRFDLRRTPWLLALAGAASGLMGTTTSIGGPPVALVYQGSTGPQLRANMSAYFLVAGLLALGGLAFAGRFGLHEVELALFLLPGVVGGLLISNWTRGWLKNQYVKPAVLLLCTVTAVVILIRYFR